MLPVKVHQLISRTGRAVPNQFIITTNTGECFQSYETIIGFRPYKDGAKTSLDMSSWDYSRTTVKYLCQWLDITPAELRQAVKNNVFHLINLN
jgi:hypothetical protein